MTGARPTLSWIAQVAYMRAAKRLGQRPRAVTVFGHPDGVETVAHRYLGPHPAPPFTLTVDGPLLTRLNEAADAGEARACIERRTDATLAALDWLPASPLPASLQCPARAGGCDL